MDYWNRKNELKKKARAHMEEMEQRFLPNILKCARHTQIYTQSPKFTPGLDNMTTIVVEELDSVSAVKRFQSDKTCVLNFASYKNPGGMFLAGSSAQEESLCHESTLYNVLSRWQSYYNDNSKNLNKALYTNRALYSPDVIFVGDEKTYHADVLTCAAPNKKAATEYRRVSEGDNSIALTDRIMFVLEVAASNKVNTLILGAFGCGVFGQNPAEVAEIFKNALDTRFRGVFNRVVFAIPDANSDNFKAFKHVFCQHA